MGNYKGKEYVTIKNDGEGDSRNRLTTMIATDLVRQLVWLYSNLCLAKRIEALEQTRPWVVLSKEEEEPAEGSGSRPAP